MEQSQSDTISTEMKNITDMKKQTVGMLIYAIHVKSKLPIEPIALVV